MLNEHLIGILSDTHDNRSSIRRAVEVFNENQCSCIIHAGDIISPFTIREFGKLKGKFFGVWGNNDGEKRGLKAQFSRIGKIVNPPGEFVCGGKKIIVMHEPDYLEQFLTYDDVDVIVYGHLHKIDIRPGKPLVINPGECCSWLTDRSTVVLLNLSTMQTEVIDVGD